jgi:hypothetical protein
MSRKYSGPPKTWQEELEDEVAGLVILRQRGQSEFEVIDNDADRNILMIFWDLHDPLSTITGDIVGKKFPIALAEYLRSH